MHKNRGDFNIHETLYKRIFVVENSYLDDDNVLHSKKEKKEDPLQSKWSNATFFQIFSDKEANSSIS